MPETSQSNAAPAVIRSQPLENGTHLEVIDASRPLAADRWLVAAVFRLTIPVSESILAGGTAHLSLAEVRRRTGDTVVFEKRMERTFIAAKEKEALLEEMVGGYLSRNAGYLALPAFARNCVMRRYRDALKPTPGPR